MSVSLAGGEAAASQGLVWLPLLPGKGSSQLPTQLPLFLTSLFLMWQLSAYHSAWCQGNHCGVGWAQHAALPQPQSWGQEGGARRGPGGPGMLWGLDVRNLLGKIPRKSSPEVILKADHSSFLLHENENLRTDLCVARFPWAWSWEGKAVIHFANPD